MESNREGRGGKTRSGNGFCDFLKERYLSNGESSEIRFFDTDKFLVVVFK